MTANHQYELLALALEPCFGNIYEFNLEPHQIAGYDVQEWTDELRNAVQRFLLSDLPSDVWEQLTRPGNDEHGNPRNEQQVNSLMDDLQPGELALAVRNAAVVAVPSLHQLIGHLETWPSEEERLDTAVWLQAHGHDAAWHTLVAVFDHHQDLLPVAMPAGRTRLPEPDDLVHALTPGELLYAWEHVVGPAHTDLSDREWQLLAPEFERVKTAGGHRLRTSREMEGRRRFFDALRFKTFYDIPWCRVPPRYGNSQSVYQAYRNAHIAGLFFRLRRSLSVKPGAAELTDWLDSVAAITSVRRPAKSV